MVVLIIFPAILQTVNNVIMLSIGGQGGLTGVKQMHTTGNSTVSKQSNEQKINEHKTGT